MKIIKSGIRFHRVLIDIVSSHAFLIITGVGNTLILGCSYVFYLLERDLNQMVNTFLDAAWWGFATATTVGYGDIIPVTSTGKILGILLMLMGTALFAMFTALFAQSILEDEILRLRWKSPKQNSDHMNIIIHRLERENLELREKLQGLRDDK